MVREFRDLGCDVDVFDPVADITSSKLADVNLIDYLPQGMYHAIVIAVAHEYFRGLGIERIITSGIENCVIFDVKGLFPKSKVDGRL